MKVAAIISRTAPLALLLTLLAGAPGVAQGASAPTAPTRSVAVPPPAVKLPYDAKILACRRSPRTDYRSAVIAASMRPVAGGRKLSLRVDLYQRPLAGGRWALRSDVPGLSVWSGPSDPSIGTRANDVFKYRYAVGRLVVPFEYRFRVTFRWTDAAGGVVREEAATTSSCKEPDLRPDLVVDSATVAPPGLDEQLSLYTVVVRNAGRSPAWNVGVAATFAAPIRTVRRLAPQESAELTFLGPICAPELPGPTFLADPANTVDEAKETNNSLAVTCPATLERP